MVVGYALYFTVILAFFTGLLIFQPAEQTAAKSMSVAGPKC